MDIIGVGDTNVDMMIQVDHLPRHDEKVRGRLADRCPGGIIGNFCCAARRFGARTGAVCKVGTDPYGEICLRDLEERGVDTTHMVVDPDAETYYCIVHLDSTGEKALTIVETSGFLPKFEELDLDYLKTGRYVHMTSLDVALALRVGEALAGSGAKLSLDIEGTASKASMDIWKRLLALTAVALPNQAGLAALTGTDSVAGGAKMLLDWGVELVVVTCGDRGVEIFWKGGSCHHPIFPVEVRDTTGAGDCFNGVFLSCIAMDWPLEQAAKYACAAAAISVGKIGARTALSTREEVEAFIREREGNVLGD